jgi:hypothetical protein
MADSERRENSLVLRWNPPFFRVRGKQPRDGWSMRLYEKRSMETWRPRETKLLSRCASRPAGTSWPWRLSPLIETMSSGVSGTSTMTPAETENDS